MKPVYERFIENPDFTKPDFIELIKCAEDPEAVRRLKEEAVRIREIYYGKKVFTRGLIEYTNYCKNDCYYCTFYQFDKIRFCKIRILDKSFVNWFHFLYSPCLVFCIFSEFMGICP